MSTPPACTILTDEGTAREDWESSVFFHLQKENAEEVRRRLFLNEEANFYKLDELRNAGHTEYIASIHRFTERGSIGEMSAFYSRWLTRQPEGFHDDELSALRMLLPTLALAVKTVCCMRNIGTITDVYLGHDAGRKVMSGTIARGEVERIEAVLWFSDLRDFTGISDRAKPDQIIPFLNDYAGLVIDAIHAHGGSVLKLIGDGVLAIFQTGHRQDDCAAALAAEMTMRTRSLSPQPSASVERPSDDGCLSRLHVGEVFYGNIGSRRQAGFHRCRPGGQYGQPQWRPLRFGVSRHSHVEDFVSTSPVEMQSLMVSLGRYALRGFARAHELFTIDPELADEQQPTVAEMPGYRFYVFLPCEREYEA